jgi:hypothetical protein
MADDTIDSQKGARICNGLGIMRACLETKLLAELEDKMDEAAQEAVERAVGRRQPEPEGIRLQ